MATAVAHPLSTSATTAAAAASAIPPHEDPFVAHTPSDYGFAKLVGADFQYVLRAKNLQLGRKMNEVGRPGFLGISTARNVSRIHAEINYIPPSSLSPGHWQIEAKSKNGLMHNEDHLLCDNAMTLKHKDRVQIGDTAFFFLEPIPTTPAVTRS